MAPAENATLVLASQWLADLATGSITTGAATIAVAGIGFAMLAGITVTAYLTPKSLPPIERDLWQRERAELRL